MEYEIKIWSIQKLIDIIKKKEQIDLNPPYQRNPIWTLRAQRSLINTIMLNQPIPNFFILKKGKNKYEMVDGQQRARTIYGFWKCHFENTEGQTYNDLYPPINGKKSKNNDFCNYKLSVTLINKINKRKEPIEDFYTLVNSSGLRLNRPEIFKAKYHDKKFLKLIKELAECSEFADLEIFSQSQLNRMHNIDFVGELVTFMRKGFTDKKITVDKLFEKDINEEEYESIVSDFKKIISNFARFDAKIPLIITRFRQRNDFYSLFAFIYNNQNLKKSTLDYYYKLLLKISEEIKPSQEYCIPLKEYAVNCVTQSNSKVARVARNNFLVELFLNSKSKPNEVQKELIKFYRMKTTDIKRMSNFTTLNIKSIRDPEDN